VTKLWSQKRGGLLQEWSFFSTATTSTVVGTTAATEAAVVVVLAVVIKGMIRVESLNRIL